MNSSTTIREGRIKRFREMPGVKQDALAAELGDGRNQQKISLLEQKQTIDPAIRQQVSDALKIPVDAFRNFDEEKAVNIIANTFTDFKDAGSAININPVDNPAEAILRLHEEKDGFIREDVKRER